MASTSLNNGFDNFRKVVKTKVAGKSIRLLPGVYPKPNFDIDRI